MTAPAEAPRSIAITGANGFLGSALCRHFVAHGHRVRGLVRDPDRAGDIAGVAWHRCELPDAIDPAGLQGVDVLVHAAFETRFTSEARARAVNVEGSRRLFEVARACGVAQIVAISSMSAHEEACSVYGRSKLEVEGLLDLQRDAAIRPGHIIGEGGVFWRTAGMIRALPFIPVFFGGRQPIQTVALEDVCRAVRVMVEKPLTGIIKFAEAEPITLRHFYATVAQELGKTPRFIPFPGAVMLVVMRALETVGFPAPLSSDNLNGLKRLRAFDVDNDLKRLGFSPRSLPESLAEIQWSRL